LARENGATILQASTSEVYGDPTIHPQVESYWGNANCFGVRGCYEEGKRVAETLMLEYARSQTRSFCYVDDLVDGLVKMAASEPSFTGPVNLGSRTELTVLETAGLIKQMTGSSSPTVFKACRPTIRGSASRTSASPSPNSAGVHESPSQRVSRGPSNISKASLGIAPKERAVSCEHRVSSGSSSD
jgi:nucleoside-diphosphate-sugar epimerase